LVGELLYNTEPADGDAFARRHNISGVGVFDCVSLLAEGATRRSKETVGEVDKLCGDIDLKDVVESADEIIRRLETSLLPPSVIILSGHGVHAKYVLKTSITDPTKVAEDPYGQGWMAKIKVEPGTTLDNLLTLDQYKKQIASKDH